MSNIKRVMEFSEDLLELSDEEFINLIIEILGADGRFINIEKTGTLEDPSYDLFADEKLKGGKHVKAIFQVKRSDLITPDYIQHIGGYWTSKGIFKNSKLYIIVQGVLTDGAKKQSVKYGIECWGLFDLFMMATPEIKSKYFGSAVFSVPQDTREDNLIQALTQVGKGDIEWSTYQILSGDIFTHLFCPPLSNPRYEHADADGRNRRDAIYENANDHTFWKMLREIYQAYYLVVDAKNSAELIGKRPVIDIAHYLKPYGCGMFGILLVREGISKAAKHAIKEQWIGSHKMILALNDVDIIEMLEIKKANGKPEEIIRMKLADFRMSL